MYQAIVMLDRRFGFFPKRFTHNGTEHKVTPKVRTRREAGYVFFTATLDTGAVVILRHTIATDAWAIETGGGAQ